MPSLPDWPRLRIHYTKADAAWPRRRFCSVEYDPRMTTLPHPRDLKVDDLGLPAWAWPLLGLGTGLLLVVVIHGTCFLKEGC